MFTRGCPCVYEKGVGIVKKRATERKQYIYIYYSFGGVARPARQTTHRAKWERCVFVCAPIGAGVAGGLGRKRENDNARTTVLNHSSEL